MSRTTAPEPYNSDPMDQPEPGQKQGDVGNFLNEAWADMRVNAPSSFSWSEIREASRAEWEARLTDFNNQKISWMVDWMLDNRQENEVPDDLLTITQGYTRDTHEVIA